MELELLDNVLCKLKQNSSVLTGPGDDCAVVKIGGENLLLAVDQLTMDVHFTQDTSPERAGAKLVKRNLSDIAAMGGTPLWMLLTINNGGCSEKWLERFILGAENCAESYDVPIVGGDTSSMPGTGFSASITIAGRAETPVLRSGAQENDGVYVTGLVGNSFASGHHLDFLPQLDEGRFLSKYASAMMDISDGLLLDISRMARASRADFFIDPQKVLLRSGASLPGALGDGEDHGLIFTSCRDVREEFTQRFPATPIARIGWVGSGRGVVWNLNNDQPFDMKNSGYEH